MEKIKVWLQYPWKFPDSPYYKYLIQNPPAGVEYLNISKQQGSITNMRKFAFLNFLKKMVRVALKLFKIPLLNAHLTQNRQDYDIIHCAHCLSLNKKPWVTDIERIWQYSVSGNNTKRELLMIKKGLVSPHCKKILPWSETTKRDLLKIFPELKNKVEVVHPAVPVQKFKKKKSGKIIILYATRYFWIKGGLVALEVYNKIKKKYGNKIELIFISDVPKEIKKQYPEIEIKNPVPQKELFGYMQRADIFFYPSMQDTFGFGLLEAMSFGLPIVTIDYPWGTPSIKEIVENNKTGFIIPYLNKKIPSYYKINYIEENLIKGLESKMDLLIKNKKLREKMAKNCIKMVKEGKFSIKERNKRLEKIYSETLK